MIRAGSPTGSTEGFGGNLFIRRFLITAFMLLLVAMSSGVVCAKEKSSVQLRILASTTAGRTGLIDHLARIFEQQNPGVKVTVRLGGGLTILDEGRLGAADLIITHLPASEKLFIDEGFGRSRTLVMYNEFLFLGPPSKAASYLVERDLLKVLRMFASDEVPFMVPSKRSGTYRKLADVWSLVGIEPDWPGYQTTGTQPDATLRDAALFDSFTFVDLGTFLANQDTINHKLVPVYRDHVGLRNYYSAVLVNSKYVPGTNEKLATRFLDFLVSPQGQTAIAQFGQKEFGAAIFTPAAHLDEGLKTSRVEKELAEKNRNFTKISVLAAALSFLLIVTTFLFYRARAVEHSRRISEERFKLAAEGSSDGIWDWDLQTNHAYFSPRLNVLLDREAESVDVEKPMEVLTSCVHEADVKGVEDQLNLHLSEAANRIFIAEFRLRNNGGRDEHDRWVLMRGKAQLDATGNAIRMSGSITDITENKRQKAEMEYNALHDALTGLPNRTLLLDRLSQSIKICSRQSRTFALLIMDLDRFKEINDTLGHPVGDLVLQQVSNRLKNVLRQSDTIARLGGDEFAILLPEATTMYANHIAQKILLALKRAVEINNHRLYVAASLGIATYPQHGSDAHSLIKRADVAMYVAKRNNEGISVYDSEQDRNSMRRLQLEKDLFEAIENSTLTLHFQPKINIRSKTVEGVEALVRWKHPELGMIPPVELIEIAEGTGLIKPLTDWIINAAMEQLAEWRSRGNELPVAINLSAWNLQDPQLVNSVRERLNAWNLPPSYIEFEVTESAMMADPVRAAETMNQLDKMGINLALDDFGTGFSSLSYLKKMPFDVLKIDRSFVSGMASDKNDASIVRSTIELAHNLEMRVVAEGVEDKQTLDELAGLGCDIAQGYYFSTPLAADALQRWLEQSPWGFISSDNDKKVMAGFHSTKSVH